MHFHRIKLPLACLAASVLLAYVSVTTVHAQGLDAIFTQQSGGDIDNINTTTGVSTSLYTATGHNWNGAAYNPVTKLLYIDDIGTTNFTTNQVITNTIYSFNPFQPASGVTEVGTISGYAAFTGAGFYNNLYYAIGTGSNQLVSYNLNGHSGSGLISQNSTQTLGGLGSGITGVSLGDLDFVGSTLYISAGTLTSTAVGAGVSATYTLYKYSTVTNTTTPILAVTESKIGVGISNDINSNQLIMFNSDGSIQTVDQTTGAESGSISLSGPAATGGAGDFTIVPEPRTYALWSMVLLLGLVALQRSLGSKVRLAQV